MGRSTHARREANRHLLRADLVLVAGVLVIGAAWIVIQDPADPVFLAVAGITLIAVAGWRGALQHAGRRWASGARGEEAVARELRRLRRRGWVALHDVPAGRGNIDHIAIGPGGVVAIETKNHARLDRVTDRMYAQALRGAARVERGTDMPTTALLVLGRARVRRADRRNDRGVTVVELRRLRTTLARLPTTLDAADVERVHARLVHSTGEPVHLP